MLKHEALINQMTLEEKCYLFSGKDFWQTRSVERLNIPNMMLSDGPHGVRKQEGAGKVIGGFFRSGKKRKAVNSPGYKLDYMLEYKENKV